MRSGRDLMAPRKSIRTRRWNRCLTTYRIPNGSAIGAVWKMNISTTTLRRFKTTSLSQRGKKTNGLFGAIVSLATAFPVRDPETGHATGAWKVACESIDLDEVPLSDIADMISCFGSKTITDFQLYNREVDITPWQQALGELLLRGHQAGRCGELRRARSGDEYGLERLQQAKLHPLLRPVTGYGCLRVRKRQENRSARRPIRASACGKLLRSRY